MRFGLTTLVILAEFLGIATAASHRGPRDSPESVQVVANEIEENVCVTQECYDTASRIKKSMNSTAKPCDDFYKFTCGGFMKNEIIPSNANLLSVPYTVNKQFHLNLKNLLEADIRTDDIGPFKQTKTLYKSCMDVDAIETAGPRPLKTILNKLGGWPVVEGASWNESNFDWMATIAKWARAGLQPSAFMKIRIGKDTQNNTQHALVVEIPSWHILSEDLDKGFNGTKAIRAYHKMVVDIAVILGADRKQAEDELKEALLFQIQLNTVRAAAQSEVHRMTVKDLIERYPGVNWKDTFAKMYSPIETIRDNDTVVVRAPDFIEEVIKLVSKTPKRVQANFATFQIIPLMGINANREITEKLANYESVEFIEFKATPRWSDCVDSVKRAMPLSVIAMYEREFFTPQKKVQIDDMVQKIRGEFRANLDKVSFMDDVTRNFAKNKENAMKHFVGYPMESLDNGKLEDYYRDLPLFNNDMFSNWLDLLKFNYEKHVRNFRQPINTLNLNTIMHTLLGSGAVSRSDLNTVLFPAEVIQGDLFHPERPRYMNFATFGTAVGHEIVHLFSGSGNQFDENGNPRDWWTPAAKTAFEERANCFVREYGSYTEDIVHQSVNGALTLDENIADNGGIKSAYHAYVNSMRGKTPEKRLPELDYTPNQMFWIAFGNSYCEKFKTEFLEYIWGREVHGIGHFRVIGSLSNIEEFATDFNCPVGSKMNPVTKCSIW